MISPFSVNCFHFFRLGLVFFPPPNGQVIVSLKSCIFASKEPDSVPSSALKKQYLHLVSVSDCKVQNIGVFLNAIDIFLTAKSFIFVCFLSSHLCMLDDSVLESD